MSSCPDSALLERLLAEQLGDAERRAVEQHVEGCADCQSTLDRLTADTLGAQGVREALDRSEHLALGHALQAPVRHVQQQLHRRRVIDVCVIFALLLAVMLLLGLWLKRDERTQRLDLPPVAISNDATEETLDPIYENSIGMQFVLVPLGHAWLGGSAGRAGEREVVIEHSFYLGRFEVTQAEWQAVMKSNPSAFSRDGRQRREVDGVSDASLHRFPVESLFWSEAQQFVARLNEQLPDDDWEYRLPTEDEWEYACRGGRMAAASESAFDFYSPEPSSALLPQHANYRNPDGLHRPCEVGRYAANSLGLHDMHGNVAEWCERIIDPNGQTQLFVQRGGSWFFDIEDCRAKTRRAVRSDLRLNSVGLRIARVRRR